MKGPKIKAENSLEFFHKNLAEQGLQENIFSNIPASSEFFTEKPCNFFIIKKRKIVFLFGLKQLIKTY